MTEACAMAASNTWSAAVALAAFVATRPARAAEPVSIWYRTAEGCPTAAEFLEGLSAHAFTAKVARAGDRIDFVVTLGRDERGSSGTLERQSARGTVAIRQVAAQSCEAVAQALMLTLALSADPDATPSATQTPAVPESPHDTEDATPPPAVPLPPTAGAATEPPDRSPQRGREIERSPWHPSFGAHGSIGTLADGGALFGGSAFVDVAFDRGARPRGRVSFVASLAAPTDALSLALLLGRLEVCPATVGRTLSFGPCAALDMGSLRVRSSAIGGRSDAAFWSAAWTLLRGAYAPSPVWALELEGGASVPLTHYEFAGGEPRQVLAETRRLTFGLAAGARFGWP